MVDMDGRPRPPESLVEYAVESVRKEILTGQMLPGTRLTTEAVAASLGISHIPVREAFRYLEAQGHVVRDGRRGVRLVPVSIDEAEDIYRTRSLLESEANRLGVPRLTAADDARLDELIVRMETAAKAADIAAYRMSNRAFHFVAFDRSDRPWLIRFLRNLWDASARYQAPLFTGSVWKTGHATRHRAILDALLSRDVDQVNALMDQHRSWLLARLTKTDQPDASPVAVATAE